ncbi:MAG: nicotinate-nucleotide adenylyltransferase [Pirellulales bacterium]
MRLGIYGGSFDPVHLGHLLLAESCREQCQLDEVWFLPAYRPPHKRDVTLAAPRHRLEMLELAVLGHAAFRVCDYEVAKEEISFTVETLRHFRRERPGDSLFFLLGADALTDFPTWRAPQEIAQLATLVSVRRSGSPEPDFTKLADAVGDEATQRIVAHQVIMPRIDLSSSELRERQATGKSLRYRTPRAVEQYIQEWGLYRGSELGSAPT